MSKIYMETDLVRNLANRLNQAGGELDSLVEGLRISANRLSIVWHGGNKSDRFIADFKSLTREMDKKAQDLQSFSVRLNSEIDQWIDVDSSFGTSPGFWDRFKTNLLGISKEDIVALYSTAGVIGLMKPGSKYAGEVILRGSRSMKEAAGISPYLNHIRADHVPDHLLKTSLKGISVVEAGLAVAEFGGKAVEDWNQYERGSEKAAAIGLDAAFVATKTVGIHYAGWAASVAAGAALVFLVPAAPAVAVAAVGLGAWWAVSHFGGKALDAAWVTYKDPLVKGGAKLIDQTGNAIHNSVNYVADIVQQASREVDEGFNNVITNMGSFFN